MYLLIRKRVQPNSSSEITTIERFKITAIKLIETVKYICLFNETVKKKYE